MPPTLANHVRQSLLSLHVDDVVRFPVSSRMSVSVQMADLKTFGENGKKYHYRSIRHEDELLIVRVA